MPTDVPGGLATGYGPPMSRPRARPRRPLELVRGGWGAACLLAPAAVAGRVGGPVPDDREQLVVRILGARQLVQAVLSGARPTPVVLAVGAWVDCVHSLTALALACTDGRRRHVGLADAGVAAAWAGLGRLDLARGGRENGEPPSSTWKDRVGLVVLPFLPGAPSI